MMNDSIFSLKVKILVILVIVLIIIYYIIISINGETLNRGNSLNENSGNTKGSDEYEDREVIEEYSIDNTISSSFDHPIDYFNFFDTTLDENYHEDDLVVPNKDVFLLRKTDDGFINVDERELVSSSGYKSSPMFSFEEHLEFGRYQVEQSPGASGSLEELALPPEVSSEKIAESGRTFSSILNYRSEYKDPLWGSYSKNGIIKSIVDISKSSYKAADGSKSKRLQLLLILKGDEIRISKFDGEVLGILNKGRHVENLKTIFIWKDVLYGISNNGDLFKYLESNKLYESGFQGKLGVPCYTESLHSNTNDTWSQMEFISNLPLSKYKIESVAIGAKDTIAFILILGGVYFCLAQSKRFEFNTTGKFVEGVIENISFGHNGYITTFNNTSTYYGIPSEYTDDVKTEPDHNGRIKFRTAKHAVPLFEIQSVKTAVADPNESDTVHIIKTDGKLYTYELTDSRVANKCIRAADSILTTIHDVWVLFSE